MKLGGKPKVTHLEEQKFRRLLRDPHQPYKMSKQLVGKDTLSSPASERRGPQTVELLARCVESSRVVAVMSGHPFG